MNVKNCFSIVLLVVLVASCTPADRQRLSFDTINNQRNQPEALLFQGQKLYDSLINFIDTTNQLIDFYSLEYTDDFQNNRTARGKLNRKNEIVKLEMEEIYSKGKQVLTYFYFKGNILFFAKQILKDYQTKSNGFKELYTYFGDNNKPIISLLRLGNDEEELLSKGFKVCEKTKFDPKPAMDLVNQKGIYETRFQGSTETDNLKFIIVGTSGGLKVQSALAYSKDFPLALHLVANEAQYINRLLKVEFTKVTGLNGFTYQGLTRIKIMDEE